MDEEQMREFIVSWLEDNLTDEQFRAEGYQSRSTSWLWTRSPASSGIGRLGQTAMGQVQGSRSSSEGR